jgi:hypothetical protein
MIRFVLGAILAVLALLLVWPGGPGMIRVLVQPWAMGVVVLFVLAPGLIAGRFSVWLTILDFRRETPLGAAEKAVLETARESARRGGLAATWLGLVYTAGSVAEPVEILAHLIGASLIGLVYGLAVSELILAPLAFVSPRSADPSLEHQDGP